MFAEGVGEGGGGGEDREHVRVDEKFELADETEVF